MFTGGGSSSSAFRTASRREPRTESRLEPTPLPAVGRGSTAGRDAHIDPQMRLAHGLAVGEQVPIDRA